MKHTKLTSLLLVLAMTITSVVLFVTPASAEAWDGTSSDTAWYGDGTATEYTVSTPAQLAGLSTLAAEGKTFAGQTVKLSADIDLGGKPWTPITNFLGTFDGGNHTVSGLRVVADEGTGNGFFGAAGGTICNLVIADAAGELGKATQSAILVGYTAAALTVENCHVTGTVEGNTSIGILVGYTKSYEITFKNVTTGGSVSGGNGVAAYVGYAAKGCTFENCTNLATVKGTGGNTGGFLGRVATIAFTFTGCTNFGSISSTAGNVGGFMAQGYGSSSSNFYNCANYGSVSLTCENTALGAGGFYGTVSSGNLYTATLNNCANYGTITATGAYAGGLTGNTGDKAAVLATGFVNAGAVSSDLTGGAGELIGKLATAYARKPSTIAVAFVTANNPAIATDVNASTACDATVVTADSYTSAVTALNAQVATWNDAKYSTWTVGNAPKIHAASVTLGDCFAVNFYGTEAPVLAPHAATVSVGGQTVAPKDGAVTVSDIKAADLSRDIAVAVKLADGTVVQEFSYSVTKYIERMTGKDAKLDALLAALSDYAKAAAGEDVDVDEAYAAVELTPVEGVDNTYATEISVLLTDSIRPIVKVAEGVAQVNVEIYGQTYTYDVVDDEVIIDCLTATSLNNAMVLSFVDAEGKVLGTTEYSVANCIKAYETYDVAKALAVYMQAVRAYNGLD